MNIVKTMATFLKETNSREVSRWAIPSGGSSASKTTWCHLVSRTWLMTTSIKAEIWIANSEVISLRSRRIRRDRRGRLGTYRTFRQFCKSTTKLVLTPKQTKIAWTTSLSTLKTTSSIRTKEKVQASLIMCSGHLGLFSITPSWIDSFQTSSNKNLALIFTSI